MKLSKDVDLERISKDTHRYVGQISRCSFCNQSALQCIREKMDVIDLEDDSIDAEILNSMVVTNEHFKTTLGTSNPSALRETIISYLFFIYRKSAQYIFFPIEFGSCITSQSAI
ncbi:hypothetical protein IFM89_031101 [Coptis chinensis]|uniref:Uncharacterized protein n=1 Tax=Coptis chinensis TaxID=261450 RepID=A0A835M785_9MAGN|nr:hypothetical protein IFM89_031101 [Coptis chinensis]